MRYRFRLLTGAQADADEAAQWYAERGDHASAGFLHELDAAIDSVVEAPLRFPRHIGRTRYFVFRTYPYSLIYYVRGDEVFIIAVAHQKRRRGYWRSRLRE